MMNSLPTRAIMGFGAAVVAMVSVALGSWPLSIGLVSATLAAALASVAFAAQSRRLRDEERLVYRPVHAVRHRVQRRVRSED